MKTIAERITKARKDKGRTQKDLARAMGMNMKNISRYELGHTVPSIEVGAQLADELGVSLDFLAGLEEAGEHSYLRTLFLEKEKHFNEEQRKALEVVLKAF